MSDSVASEEVSEESEVLGEEPVCRYCGRTLVLKRINESVAMLLCPNVDCIYPLDQADLSPFMLYESDAITSNNIETDEYERNETEQPPEPINTETNLAQTTVTETTAPTSSPTKTSNPSMFFRTLYTPPPIHASGLQPMKPLSFTSHM